MSKEKNFNKFKSIAGVTFILVLILALVNLLSLENSQIQIHENTQKWNVMSNIKPNVLTNVTSNIKPNVIKNPF